MNNGITDRNGVIRRFIYIVWINLNAHNTHRHGVQLKDDQLYETITHPDTGAGQRYCRISL